MTLLDLLPIVAIVAIMYLLLIRPAKKRQQEQNRMISALTPGVTVMTASGILGTVQEVGPEIGLEIAPGVVVRMVPGAIARVIPSVAGSDDSALSLPGSSDRSNDADPQQPESQLRPGTAGAAGDFAVAEPVVDPQTTSGVESRQQP